MGKSSEVGGEASLRERSIEAVDGGFFYSHELHYATVLPALITTIATMRLRSIWPVTNTILTSMTAPKMSIQKARAKICSSFRPASDSRPSPLWSHHLLVQPHAALDASEWILLHVSSVRPPRYRYRRLVTPSDSLYATRRHSNIKSNPASPWYRASSWQRPKKLHLLRVHCYVFTSEHH